MNRSNVIIAVALAAAGLAAAGALTLAMTTKPATRPAAAVTVTASPSDTALRPVTFATGSPEYEQLQACLFKAGYTGSYVGADTTAPSIHFTGKGIPEINFTVDTVASPRTITPEAGRDTVLLNTAGCL